MKISGMKVNHRVNPMGYDFPYLHFDWMTEDTAGKEAASVRLVIQEQAPDGGLTAVYDSGRVQPDLSGGLDADYVPSAGKRYVWQVEVISDRGDSAVSAPQWFETGKPSAGEFLTAAEGKAPAPAEGHPGTDCGVWAADWLKADPAAESVRFAKTLTIEKDVARARLYLCGLGLYEAYVDGGKMGDEYLMPGYHSYDLMQEYQTLDVTGALTVGQHELSVILGNGWYKGRFVFEGGFENLYGDQLKLIAELQLIYADGSREVIGTDASWSAQTGKIGGNSIYDGEVQDYRLAGAPVSFAVDSSGKELLQARTGMPIRDVEQIAPTRILHTPAGETVLDFGQMITGWVSFFCRQQKDAGVRLQYGELLQQENFYRDNLRTAKAEFVYISDGTERWVRPHFTYYGFRYVKLEGFAQVRAEDFQAVRLLSEIYPAGELAAGDGSLPDAEAPASGTPAEKVNRLIANVRASQKGNFLSVPTDCPQRDERMGWTGDIAVFADTACLNTDCTDFLSHYVEMLGREQELLNGCVPLFVPRPKVDGAQPGMDYMLQMASAPMCVWGDAAVILPWRLYEHRRDRNLLARQYPVMKAWVDCVKRRVDENPKPHLWQNDLQLGDWLALDSGEETSFGLTDSGYLATACYAYCLSLTRKAADVIGRRKEAEALAREENAVREAFREEFMNADGTVTITPTQTAYALLLSFQLFRPGQEGKALDCLEALVQAKGGHLDTGFLGTAWLCQALSEYGGHETACEIFLQEDYPGWLHEVNLGAVTTWERWNSLDENGEVSSTGMNSMNHYAYGSIAAWMYRYLCGFVPCTDVPGTVKIRPLICPTLGQMRGSYQAPWGVYSSAWRMISDTEAEYTVTVPFGGKACLILPGQEAELLPAGTYTRTGLAADARWK